MCPVYQAPQTQRQGLNSTDTLFNGIFLKTLILCEGTKRFAVHITHIMTQPFSLSDSKSLL